MISSFLGSKEDILKELNVDTKIGLTKEAQKSSLEKYGANSFTKEKSATLFQKICHIISKNIRIIKRTYDINAYICRINSDRCKHCSIF